MKRQHLLALAALIVIAAPNTAWAYIGPGAGFAFLGSTFVFVLTFFMALATILFWPIQWAWRKARGYGISKHARTRRVVIVGLDGLEPKLVDQYMKEGRLPNLQAVAETGSYDRLGTTLPALSPVAWSTFQTGVNPGAHNIFDFLTRDKRHCLPLMASTDTIPGRTIKVGPWKFKIGSPKVQITRKSQPFWKILGKHGVFSNIIRVPISFPPEKFSGTILSAMCTPDLRGSQGTFFFFTTRPKAGLATTGGEVQEFTKDGAALKGTIVGPPNPKKGRTDSLEIPFKLTPNLQAQTALLEIGGEKITLKHNQFTDWIPLEFRFGWRGKIAGITRFCLRELGEHTSLYLMPLNADPEKPALPIAHPIYFSSWIAKRQGSYGTLGLMEDTWGRNEFALDDQRFLDQAYLTHNERERMFLEALDLTREGLCACVFDASDRIQHMFWRYLDDAHPSPREGAEFEQVIPNMYRKMDELVGKVKARLKPNDVLVILSDHGFASFRRCINLNTWLMQQGYLTLKEGKTAGADYFKDVDWSKTKAYAVGLSGLYINIKGRESVGIVDPKDAEALKQEISRKLEALKDPADGASTIRTVHDTNKAYRGLYKGEAPDLIIGYFPGYRVSWESVTGTIEPQIFSDNVKAWSGDHHVDPELIPGILLTNRKLTAQKPHIVDIAPTMLDLFAIKVPGYMEGRVIL